MLRMVFTFFNFIFEVVKRSPGGGGGSDRPYVPTNTIWPFTEKIH